MSWLIGSPVVAQLPDITRGTISIGLQPIATGMAAPDYAISPPGDMNRLFVVEQNGLLRIIQNGTLLPGAALDLQSRVQPPLVPTNPNDERGFLGLAFHPGYNTPTSPGFRTLYTYTSEPIDAAAPPTYPAPNNSVQNFQQVISEYKASAADPNLIDPLSRRVIFTMGKTAGNHNGGTVAFGPDGYLYAGARRRRQRQRRRTEPHRAGWQRSESDHAAGQDAAHRSAQSQPDRRQPRCDQHEPTIPHSGNQSVSGGGAGEGNLCFGTSKPVPLFV